MFNAATPRLVFALLSICVLAAFTGCMGTGGVSSVSGQDSMRTLTLSGNTNWTLAKWTSADGEKQAIPKTAPTLLIGYRGRVSGHAFVNDYVGNVIIADDVLNWGPHIAVTRMSGTPEAMEDENRYLTDLKATTGVTIHKGRLVFVGPKPLRLEFVQAPPL